VRHRLDAPLRETKPNLGKMGHLGDGTHSEAPDSAKQSQFGLVPVPVAGEMRQTKPIHPRPTGRAAAGSYCTNKAKFERKWLKEKRLWWIGHPGELRGSKANPRRLVRKPVVQTKPILRPGFVQSAGARQSRQTNPICPRTDRNGRGASTESNAPNNPISGRSGL
jgi:hypothetical protein